jgi:hypothetical protein
MSIPESFADLPLKRGADERADRPTSLASLGGQAHPRSDGGPAAAGGLPDAPVW